MSRSQPSSGPAGGGAPRGDPLSPALSVVSFQYHTVPPEKLVAKTLAGLVSAGIPSSALGRVDAALAVTVTGCIVLNAAARDSLPSQLGGSDSSFAGSPATLDLAGKSVRSSPSSPSGASSPFVTPTRPRSASPSPGAALSPSTADKARAHEALAAGYMASVRVRDELLAAQAAAARAQTELTGARLRSSARQRGEAPLAAAGAAEGAAESDEASRLLAEAEAGVEAAADALASADTAAEAAAQHVADLESAVSALSLGSPAPSRTPSGSSIRGMDMAREQQHLLASAQSAGLASDAIAILSAFPVRFPLIYRALLKSCGGSSPAVLSDFSLLALVPAVQAARQQEWGLDQLRGAVTRTAASAGDAGTAAVQAFADHTFDFNGAQAITQGDVALELSPLDMCLGVLPLTQLAVHLWLQYHSYKPVDSTVLVELARSVTFVVNGRLDPAMGLARFLPAWAQTLGAEAEFPHVDVHCLLMHALGRDALAPGGGHVTAPVRGAPMTWTTFAFDRTTAWEAECTARHVHTLAELETFVVQLRAFGLACRKMYQAAGNIRSPTVGGSSVMRAAAVASPPDDSAPPPPPPAGVPATGPSAGAVRPAPGNRRHRWGHRAPKAAPAPAGPPPPTRTPPATLRVSVQVIPTPVNILAVTPLTEAGWTITLRGHADGSALSCPGCARPFPLRRDAAGNIFVDLVSDGGASYTIFDDHAPAHRALKRHPFLLDTGAEVSIVGPQSMSMLRALGSVPAVVVHSFAGATSASLQTGVLLISPPAGATATVAPGAVVEGVVYEGVHCMRVYAGGGNSAQLELETDAAAAHVMAARAVRASAFPPTRHPHVLAERFNCPTGAAVKALVEANPLGTSPSLCDALDSAAVFDQGLAMGTLKAPPIHAARCTISMAIRDAVPPGHVWWTDNSNTHPPDFAGNTYSRLFADERTSAAVTFYASRKDSTTFVQHLEELKLFIAQNVPGGHLSVIRCDFASEAVRQGHGDAIATTELRAFLAANPGTRLIPVPPGRKP